MSTPSRVTTSSTKLDQFILPPNDPSRPSPGKGNDLKNAANEVVRAQRAMKPAHIGSNFYNFNAAKKLIQDLTKPEYKHLQSLMRPHHIFSYYKGKDAQGNLVLKVAFTPTPKALDWLKNHVAHK